MVKTIVVDNISILDHYMHFLGQLLARFGLQGSVVAVGSQCCDSSVDPVLGYQYRFNHQGVSLKISGYYVFEIFVMYVVKNRSQTFKCFAMKTNFEPYI